MKSPTSIHPTLEQFHRLGISDLEQLRRYLARVDDERSTVASYVRRDCEEVACDINEDGTPQLISDDEPTVPLNRRRITDVRAVDGCRAG